MSLDIDAINRDLGHDPEALVRWALSLEGKVICTTNFRPFEAVILPPHRKLFGYKFEDQQNSCTNAG